MNFSAFILEIGLNFKFFLTELYDVACHYLPEKPILMAFLKLIL